MADAVLSLEPFADPGLTEETLLSRLAWLKQIVGPRLERFMGYYRNPTTELSATLPCASSTSFAVRPFRQYQELGLPARITGFRRAADGGAVPTGAIDHHRKEVVIENDIGWRINTMVDFAAAKMPVINSTATEPDTQRFLTPLIYSILNAGGGLTLLQNLILEGAINGSAWVHIRPTGALLERLANSPAHSAGGSGAGPVSSDPDIASATGPATSAGAAPLNVAQWLRLEIVETGRLCPLPQGGDPHSKDFAYAALLMDSPGQPAAVSRTAAGLLERMRGWFSRSIPLLPSAQDFSFDLFGSTHWQRYINGNLSAQGPNPLDILPFIRFENQSDPAAGSRVGAAGSSAVDTGMSDVESLIGLQDELNTRLSDRAFRVTMTSFRMYLGRGIDDFTKRPIGPGQMWATDNPQATIESFGGDAAAPSEETHIDEVRDALDKISGVSPIAAGLIGGKVGNLTSAVALRLTLIALLARTDRKRAALTTTLSAIVEAVLGILDRADLLATNPKDRGIEISWPTPLPESDMDRLQEAQIKLALGIPRDIILSELGYETAPPATPATPTTPPTPTTSATSASTAPVVTPLPTAALTTFIAD